MAKRFTTEMHVPPYYRVLVRKQVECAFYRAVTQDSFFPISVFSKQVQSSLGPFPRLSSAGSVMSVTLATLQSATVY